MTSRDAAVAGRSGPLPKRRALLWIGLAAGSWSSGARVISDNSNLTSPGTFGVMVRTAAPIALAGLAGLFAERSGTVNIGLEGMMIMGTIFAGWWGWELGPWMAIARRGDRRDPRRAAARAGHGRRSASTTSCPASPSTSSPPASPASWPACCSSTRAGAGIEGGSISNSPGVSSPIGRFTLPLLSGGDLFGWTTPDPLGWLADKEWFVISDVAGLLKGLTSDLSLDIILAAGVFVASVYVLWRMPFGLRLRSAGERPSAADSLGVPVLRYRYYGMIISGGLAGFGGAVMVLFANRYQENQVGGRGFLGLATLIVGNWRPAGVAAGAGLFGYFQGITLRTNPEQLVLALLLVASLGLGVAALVRGRPPAVGAGADRRHVVAVACGWLYVIADRPNNQFVYITPYLVTLIIVSVRGQALRPPAQAGVPWRKGMQV